MLGQPHSKKKSVFWCSDRASCVSLGACCFLPCQWAHLKRAWLHLLYTFLLFIFHLPKISLNILFSREFHFLEAGQQMPSKMMLYNMFILPPKIPFGLKQISCPTKSLKPIKFEEVKKLATIIWYFPNTLLHFWTFWGFFLQEELRNKEAKWTPSWRLAYV